MPKKKTNVSRKKAREFQILKINSGTLSFPSILYFSKKLFKYSCLFLPLGTAFFIWGTYNPMGDALGSGVPPEVTFEAGGRQQILPHTPLVLARPDHGL